MSSADVVRKITADRLMLAGEHLRAADDLLVLQQYRSAISRQYYAMYQAARAIVYGTEGGDDYERHAILPDHLPPNFPSVATARDTLNFARLLRNEADYNVYPVRSFDWMQEALDQGPVAAGFVADFENYAQGAGLV